MAMVSMSKQEFSRLDVLLRVQSNPARFRGSRRQTPEEVAGVVSRRASSWRWANLVS